MKINTDLGSCKSIYKIENPKNTLNHMKPKHIISIRTSLIPPLNFINLLLIKILVAYNLQQFNNIKLYLL